MGRMKKMYEELMRVEPAVPQTPPPVVHVMLCDDRPIAVYVDRQTAEYEAHLCKQADEQMGEAYTYVIKAMSLITHRLDS